jgi:ubiquinone/menaquinone biosynthesis C-methylase UbiE
MTDPGNDVSAESARILDVYEERRETIPWDRYSVASDGALFMDQQRERAMVRMLRSAGLFPLSDTRILDVGCGRGGWLVRFESWGAAQRNLAGVDIDPFYVTRASERLREADIRRADGESLPWPDGSFDLVVQGTVFTSILDDTVRRRVAAEMTRVLAPGGAVLWYDFFRDNPRNPDVRGVRKDELRSLFPELSLRVRRATLAPPIARRIAPVSWLAASALDALRLLDTHYLALLRRDG